MSTACWFALDLPDLPLDALTLPSSPSAVVVRGRVFAANTAAVDAGVRPGQRLATALGLCPALLPVDRQPPAEAACLHRLACWAGQFTPTVSLYEGGLLLEVGGCRRLFGGLSALSQRIIRELAGQGVRFQLAGAPTPLGARWLARGRPGQLTDDLTILAACLDTLPWALPDWPETIHDRLQAFGLRHLGELRRLPGSGLRQRLGPGVPDDLARAYGDLPDPQRLFEFPEHFAQHLELPARVEHADALAFAAQRLLEALGGWLRARQRRLHRACLQLTHERGQPPGELWLQTGEATADPERLVRLLREVLARTRLAQPVYALTLVADELTVDRGDSRALFSGPGEGEGEGVQACLARLSARLGEAAVCQPLPVADHRPEMAIRTPATGEAKAGSASSRDTDPAAVLAGSRPLWLLEPPRRLQEVAGRPCWEGPLHSLSRPERIESGWWDAGETTGSGPAIGDIRRDYFVARNRLGQRLWIYRDAEGWFLHGLFA